MPRPDGDISTWANRDGEAVQAFDDAQEFDPNELANLKEPLDTWNAQHRALVAAQQGAKGARQTKDALVFTGGIGENAPPVRAVICQASRRLGVDLDDTANARGGPRITSPASIVSAWVVPTNEELIIDRHTSRVLGQDGSAAGQPARPAAGRVRPG